MNFSMDLQHNYCNNSLPAIRRTLSMLPMRKKFMLFSFTLMRILSTAECVYEVTSTDLPQAFQAEMSCAMTVVLPVPGIPRINE